MKTLLTLLTLIVLLAAPAAAGTVSIPIDAQSTAVNHVCNGAFEDQYNSQSCSLEYAILHKAGMSTVDPDTTITPYQVAYIGCSSDSSEDLVFSFWDLYTTTDPDTLYKMPAFVTFRGDSVSTLSPGQTARYYIGRKVDPIYFSAGKGTVMYE